MTPGWSFWIDRGGTFTDIVARAPSGELVVHKLLSENPGRYVDAAVHGIGAIMSAHGDAGGMIAEVKLGTTVATNALLERTGEPTLLAITRGLGDLLRIGHQARPRLFDLDIQLPEPLYGAVVEIDERVLANGVVERPLDAGSARREFEAAYASGYRALAIVLMHAWRAPDHELALETMARDIGFDQVSASHKVSPLMKIVPRGDTTVVDAYLSPPLRRYIDGLLRALPPAAPLTFMQSNGGLASADRFRGRDAILSGPAGGVVGMTEVAGTAGFGKVIGFDMGGTSTDVSHFAGELERTLDTEVAGVRLRGPMMSIHTVAAGGGSICRFDGARLRVGPQSAGADPGPACYRRGGPLTVTDCNLVLGRLREETFPAVFGPDGDAPPDRQAARARLAAVTAEMVRASGTRLEIEALAEGFLAIAVDAMAHAIKHVSLARGHDLKDHALVAFGGAGGQHACLVADALGMETVLISPMAGVLSAYGIGRAERRGLAHRTIERPLTAARDALDACFAELENDLVSAAGDPKGRARRFERRAYLKVMGSDSTISLPASDLVTLEEAFHAAYAQRFAFTRRDATLVVESAEVELIERDPRIEARSRARSKRERSRERFGEVFMGGAWVRTRILDRDDLEPGVPIAGPAVIHEATGANVIESGWTADVRLDTRDLVLRRVRPIVRAPAQGSTVDPVRLELFANLFMAIAEQMGVALQSTAYSVNIKERLDFSCALFDAGGRLVANAPHMPVHLGSMGDSVRQVIETATRRRDPLAPGDVYALNNPYGGGTHLPDITVVMPIFDDAGRSIVAFVAARGHHADVGGITPGSMPPTSTRIEQEGALLDSLRLVHAGTFDEAAFRTAMTTGPYPARNIEQNLGDIRAQVAACARGARDLEAAMAAHGADIVITYMNHVQANAAAAVRTLLTKLPSGRFRYEADDGWVVEVAVTVDSVAGRATVDFTGTSAQLKTNFNAPPSIARAATLYVLRTLIGDDIPMNDGCMELITIVNPAGCLLNPAPGAAVVSGNVETSQVVTDALYGAVGAVAAAQGTMNNFTFGDDTRQYYETICGGAGAGPGFDGASAVHTHMTNSRLTDPEVLETRFPVVLDAFSIRRGSGGSGEWRGGDGVVRMLRFLEPMAASIISNRRRVAPFGLGGGASGASGRNSVVRADGSIENLGACATIGARAGDTFVIETPGGGGFGVAR